MKRRHRGRPLVVGAISPGPDPLGMDRLVWTYLESIRVRGFSEYTIRARIYGLKQLQRWCAERGILRPSEVTKPILERFQHYLFLVRRKDGHLLSMKTQADRLMSVKMFFRYLSRNNIILSNPASDLDLPKVPRRLPHSVLSVEEVEQVLAQPDVNDPLGLRDRAILETFYSTAMRRAELMRLGVADVDVGREVVLIREGKGKRDRVVPIGERALAWIERYMADVRPNLVVGPDPGNMFLTVEGGPVSESWLTSRVGRYIRKTGLRKEGGCHLFRHTAATLMLEGGADVRFVQDMLGHASLETTQIYTHVSIRKLKQVHTATHPGARLGRDDESAAAQAEAPAARSALAVPAGVPAAAAAETLTNLAADHVRYSCNPKFRVRAPGSVDERQAAPNAEAVDGSADNAAPRAEPEILRAALAAESDEEGQG